MDTDTIPQISAEVWSELHQRTRGFTAPCVFARETFAKPLFTEDDGLELARNVIVSRDVSVNVDGRLLHKPVLPPPPKSMLDFESFTRLFASLNQAEAVTFTRDYCLKYSNRVANKVRAFIHGHVSQRGIPAAGVNVVFIGGRYKSTWIGLHNDFCDTFLFPLHGGKKMLLWEPPYFEHLSSQSKPGLNGICFGHIDISRYEADANIFDVAAGELLFIPALWWHYNKLERAETTLTLSVGVFHKGPLRNFVDGAIRGAIEVSERARIEEPLMLAKAQSFSSLPSIRVPRSLSALADSIRDGIYIQYLLKSSANGVVGGGGAFRSLPSIDSISKLVGRLDSPIIFVQTTGDSGLLFAVGQLRFIENVQHSRVLIESLINSNYFRLSDIPSDGPAFEAVKALVEWLYERGAIDIAGET